MSPPAGWGYGGSGDIKLLYDERSRRTRIVMQDSGSRRVLLNHYVQPDADLRPAPSEADERHRAFAFTAADSAAGGASVKRTFALRFKAETAAAEFDREYRAAQERNKGLLSSRQGGERGAKGAGSLAAAEGEGRSAASSLAPVFGVSAGPLPGIQEAAGLDVSNVSHGSEAASSPGHASAAAAAGSPAAAAAAAAADSLAKGLLGAGGSFVHVPVAAGSAVAPGSPLQAASSAAAASDAGTGAAAPRSAAAAFPAAAQALAEATTSAEVPVKAATGSSSSGRQEEVLASPAAVTITFPSGKEAPAPSLRKHVGFEEEADEEGEGAAAAASGIGVGGAVAAVALAALAAGAVYLAVDGQRAGDGFIAAGRRLQARISAAVRGAVGK